MRKRVTITTTDFFSPPVNSLIGLAVLKHETLKLLKR